MKPEPAPGHDGRRLDFELERTTRDDGRYVLFYSWPSRGKAAARADEAAPEAPELRPSSPETDPGRV